MKIIACSDQHLGYKKSDKASFNDFLDDLKSDSDLTTLVLLGDVVDMWRRDASGVFLENGDTMEKIESLRPRVEVRYVAGNHDFHVLQLQQHTYPFCFEQKTTITDHGRSFRFQHGWEWDSMQQPPIMEALCRTMSDGTGNFESDAWATITQDWNWFSYGVRRLFQKGSIMSRVNQVMTTPEVRLQDTVQEVDKQAFRTVQPGEVLVYGHTHRPFVNKEENLVNIGSWVTDSQVHNTYVEISNGQLRLLVYSGSEILERVEV